LTLPPPDPRYTARELEAAELPRVSHRSDKLVHWCQRSTFLERAAPYLKFVGAFDGDCLKSYAVLVRHATNSTLLDIRILDSCFSAGAELLRWLTQEESYRPPLTVNYVLENTETYSLLTAAGLSTSRRYSLLSRNLRVTFPSADVDHQFV